MKQKKRNYARGRKNIENARQPWTIRDEDMVLQHSVSDRELAKIIKRSVFSIQLKRCRLRKDKQNE